MRLKTFRIVNCLGFRDSGQVSMESPQGFIYLLGRNSSGKTSFIDGLSLLEYGNIPGDHPRYQNFTPTDKLSYLEAQFSLEDDQLSLEKFIEDVTSLLAEKNGALKDEIKRGNDNITRFLDALTQEYQNIFSAMNLHKSALILKEANSQYRFIESYDKQQAYSERKNSVDRLINSLLPQGKFRLKANTEINASIDFQEIESTIFRQMPDIYKIGDSFPLSANIRDRITDRDIEGLNEVEKGFIDFVAGSNLRSFLRSNDPDERAELLKSFQDAANEVSARINSGATDHEDLLEFVLHENNGLQITIKTDGKKSFYSHLSDSTKFLIAYHIYTINSNTSNSILLFDEPNTGFHPSAHKFVLNFLRSLASQGNLVVVSTHSEYMIDLDLLPGVRVMGRDEKNTLKVFDHPYRLRGSSASENEVRLLALQPILDAIGLRYGTGLLVSKNIVLTEGVTDLLYLKAFNSLLKVSPSINLAPGTGDSSLLTLVGFFVAQGVSIKIIIDAGGMKKKLQKTFGIPDETIWEVPIPDSFDKVRSSGIEDLFSKTDFLKLLRVFEVDVDEEHFSKVPNSSYMRRHADKRIVAHRLLSSIGSVELDFDAETTDNFRRVLEFCGNEVWFDL